MLYSILHHLKSVFLPYLVYFRLGRGQIFQVTANRNILKSDNFSLPILKKQIGLLHIYHQMPGIFIEIESFTKL